MKISISDLKQQIFNKLSKNFNEEDSNVISDYFVWAEMCGNDTQGLAKMTGSDPIQNIIAEFPIKIEKETPVSALLDGGKNPAMIVAEKTTEIAIKKAKETGMSIVGARNFFSSNGAQAYYVEKIAKEDLIGIMVSRCPGSVAGFGSIDPILGTNPIGYAFPTNDEPIIFDAATSAIPWYRLVVAKAKGEKIPEGFAIDKDGNIVTDPAIAMDGALNPFGNSHKASGLSMLVELLSGPLIGGAYLDYETFDKEWGTTVIAIDPNIFVDVDKFKDSCSEFISIIRNSRTRPNESIYIPNDNSRKNYKKSMESGYVEVDEVIYNKIFNEE